MKKFPLLSLSLVFLLIFSSCLNDIDDVVSIEERPDPAILENYNPIVRSVIGSLVGFVQDENGDPIIDADVSLGSLTTETDDFGHFFFNDVTLNARGSLVQVTKNGYFDGSRRFFPLENERSYIKIELINMVFAHSFNALAGGSVSLPGGASVVFESGTVSKSNGESYDGNVSLAAEWLNPTLASTLERMPGNLQGVDEYNQEVALGSYGMIAVELQGSGGEALNIAEGATATLTMPVPAAMRTNAPAEIPLWSYYEPLGIWIKEGVAAFNGTEYVGEVSHFSFWNCDAPFPVVEFEAQFIDAYGNPLVNHQVNILFSGSYTGAGWTDYEGYVSGLIPSGEELELQVLNICYEVIFTMPMGPFSDDISLGPITVPEGTGVNTTIITGELLNCDAQPVAEGLVIAEYLGQTVYLYTDGTPFELMLTSCSGLTEVVVTGFDLTDLTQSEPLVVNPNTQTDLGQISVCDQQLQSYFVITIDGVTATYPNAIAYVSDSSSDTTSTGNTSIQVVGQSGVSEAYIYIGFNGSTIGDYGGESENFIEVLYDDNFGWQFQGGHFENFDVTAFGAEEESIVGSFSGTLDSPNGSLADVNGSFSIIR